MLIAENETQSFPLAYNVHMGHKAKFHKSNNNHEQLAKIMPYLTFINR